MNKLNVHVVVRVHLQAGHSLQLASCSLSKSGLIVIGFPAYPGGLASLLVRYFVLSFFVRVRRSFSCTGTEETHKHNGRRG